MQFWATMKFDFQKFYEAVNAKRTERAASWRQVAREIGIGKSTLARMAQNKRPDADGLAALSFWAQLNPADFVFIEPPASSPGVGLGNVSLATAALRTDSPPSA
jgi:transcriptional regulator with XRE-family HTH domain